MQPGERICALGTTAVRAVVRRADSQFGSSAAKQPSTLFWVGGSCRVRVSETCSSAMNSPVVPLQPITMHDLEELGERLRSITRHIREALFEPDDKKQPPKFNATQVGELCGKTVDQMRRLLEKAEERGLPSGLTATPGEARGKTRSFTLEEARRWVAAELGDRFVRAPGTRGATVVVGNFKGGVGKTVLAACLAQGLSLRGYRVLCIDYDPQGSLTHMLGVDPLDVADDESVLPLTFSPGTAGARDTLQASIRKTYWDGIDLVPGCRTLTAGEFYLPSRQMESSKNEPGFVFLKVLDDALNAGIRDDYDFIIIDTPPTLSYMTMTAFWAADALLVPLPPEGIDFASSYQFFRMLSELASTSDSRVADKTYSWVGVVPSKVNLTQVHTQPMLRWMQKGFNEFLWMPGVPGTAAVGAAGAAYETIYDVTQPGNSRKTYARAREAYENVVSEVERVTRQTLWRDNGGKA